MAKLPYSRVVKVNLSRNAFVARRGFGIALFLSTVAVVGILDETHRTKYYTSMDEIRADHLATTQVYKAALKAFSQNPRPIGIKVGYVDTPTGGLTDDSIKDELDAIVAADPDFYWIGHEAGMRDTPTAAQHGIIEWTEANRRQAFLGSVTADLKNPSNTTNVAAVHKGNFERSSVHHIAVADDYGDFAFAASLSTYNFDDANSAYTAKFKTLEGITPADVNSSQLTAITGFVEEVGQSTVAGHCANAYIDIGDRNFTVEGSTLTPNVFIDEIHATDWIIARTEEEMLNVMLNNKRIPFDDSGMAILASAVELVMNQARRAGIIANDIDPLTGLYAPAVIITVPSVFDVPESQRKARIAPAIAVEFRYAGAVHYAKVEYSMQF